MTMTKLPNSISLEQSAYVSAASEIIFPKQNAVLSAFKDIQQGIKKWRTALMLAYLDVKLRYRRSVLGPFWITISMGITVFLTGYLYGHLFHVDLQSYYPFFAAGMLAWSFISAAIPELTEAFVLSDSLIKQIKLPYSLYIHRVATRNLIIFFHNIVVIVPVLAIFHQVAKVNLNTLLLIPNLCLLYINLISYGFILAMIGARYRDVLQIIKSLVQIAFFVTPVLWNPIILPAKDHYLVLLNPFYALVELIRAPLMGVVPAASVFYMMALITVAGLIICFTMLKKYRARIVYWL
jgi:lipopolysaccharide transport system permease protein